MEKRKTSIMLKATEASGLFTEEGSSLDVAVPMEMKTEWK